MSWSISFIGKPEKVSKALDEYSEKMTGYSKTEFDAALPHLKGLVEQNFNKKDDAQLVKITASGHGHAENGEDVYRTLAANVEVIYGLLV